MEFIIDELHKVKKYKKDNCIQIIVEKLFQNLILLISTRESFYALVLSER
jgi:hypothetical protein